MKDFLKHPRTKWIGGALVVVALGMAGTMSSSLKGDLASPTPVFNKTSDRCFYTQKVTQLANGNQHLDYAITYHYNLITPRFEDYVPVTQNPDGSPLGTNRTPGKFFTASGTGSVQAVIDGKAKTLALQKEQIHLNDGVICTPQIPGNGIVEGLEQCDDGNYTNNDGCSDIGNKDPGFVCVGNAPSRCSKIPVCGDGKIQDPESCDPGATAQAGCSIAGSSACRIATGYTCVTSLSGQSVCTAVVNHLQCIGSMCSQVPGAGSNTCSTNENCRPSSSSSSFSSSRSSSQSSIRSSLGSSHSSYASSKAPPSPEFHLSCIGSGCYIVPGAGPNTCTTNANCVSR